MLQACTEE